MQGHIRSLGNLRGMGDDNNALAEAMRQIPQDPDDVQTVFIVKVARRRV